MGVAGHVNQNIAQSAVYQPRRHLVAMQLAVFVDLFDGDFQLIQLVIAGFVNPRGLAGGPDKHAAEQVTQGRVVVPVQQQAGQQFRASQKRAVRRGCSTHHEVVAAAGAGVAAIGHELFGGQMGFKRCVVQKFGVFDEFAPVAHGVDVDFDHAGVWRDLQQLQARVAWRRVPFQHDLYTQTFGCGFNGGQ